MENSWLTAFKQQIAQIDGIGGWTLQVFIVVLAILLINFFLVRVLRRLIAKTDTSKNPWDDAVIHSIRQPLRLLVWVVGLSFAAEIIRAKTAAPIFQFIGPARSVGVIAALTWFLFLLVRNFEQALIKQNQHREEPIDHTTVYALGKLVRTAILITAALVVLQTLGFSVSGVLAFGGIGGIAIGFAAKDLLANFFGGLMIYLDRPFAIGDWIRSPDKEIEGTVEDIGWRLTRIRRFDKRPLYVPNAVFTTVAVENPSRMSHRRIHEVIGIRYDDLHKMGSIVEAVKKMLRGHPEIDQSQTMIVNFNTFNASSLDFFVYTFTRTTEWVYFHEVKQDVLLKIAGIIEDSGAEIAFPTTTLQIPEGVAIKGEHPGIADSQASSGQDSV